jgi:hypothetical protein
MSPAGTDIAVVEDAFERFYCVGFDELGPDIMFLCPSIPFMAPPIIPQPLDLICS